MHSVANWIEDLFWKQLDVTYPGMPDAMVTPLVKLLLMFRVLIELEITCVCLLLVCLMLQVHHGFYTAYYNTTMRHEILKSIKWARKTYGNLPINVVGHSMGGALASFCALDLSVSNVLGLLHQISIYALLPWHVLLIYQMVGFNDIFAFSFTG